MTHVVFAKGDCVWYILFGRPQRWRLFALRSSYRLVSAMQLLASVSDFSCSSSECLGIHSGAPQSANLGDGDGPVNQTVELRADFGVPLLGPCIEQVLGGNHLRSVRK